MDAERLKRARAVRKLSQSQIAELLEVDRTTYAKYEQGVNNPTLARLEKLAEILEVTPNYLMGQEDDAIPLAHQDIFDLYLKLSDEEKIIIDSMIKSLANKNK